MAGQCGLAATRSSSSLDVNSGATMTVKWKMLLPLWWAFVWRFFVFALVAGIPVALLALPLESIDVLSDAPPLWFRVVKGIAALLASLAAFRSTLDAHLMRLQIATWRPDV